MADKTITDLTPLATPASNDVLAIVDVSGNETKKIEVRNLVPDVPDANRVVVNFGSASGMVAGQLYTLIGGVWTAVDASVGGEATTKGFLALSLGTNPVSDGMLVQGIGQLNHNPGTTGSILYIGTGTPGQLTATQPSATNEFSRVVGYQLGNSEMFLLPSQDYIKIA